MSIVLPTIIKITATWKRAEDDLVEVQIMDTCLNERRAWVEIMGHAELGQFYVSYDDIDNVTSHDINGQSHLLGKPKA